MKPPLDPSLRHLNDCGCCEAISIRTPAKITNRPGLAAIAYRVGIHTQFKHSLLARLAGTAQRVLQQLTTRDEDDFTIALLDAWATVGDVLTFYQERIANESYLRTASERLSLLELGRLIGYELRPGVAAGTCLAFTLEDAPGAFGQTLTAAAETQRPPEPSPPVVVDIGTRVQSVPGPGEQAQIFETTEKIEIRTEWNLIKPRMSQPQILSTDMGSVFVTGTTIDLKAGDVVMIAAGPAVRVTRGIQKVTRDEMTKTTRIDFEIPPPPVPAYERPAALAEGHLDDFPAKAALDEMVVQDIVGKTWKEEDLSALAKIQNWSVEELVVNIGKQTGRPSAGDEAGVFVFRQRAQIFGYNAVKIVSYTGRVPKPPSQWDEWDLDGEQGDMMYLDSDYEAVLPGSYVAIQKADETKQISQIEAVQIRPRTAYGLSAKSTVLTLAESWWDPTRSGADDFQVVRDTTVLVQSESLELAQVPIDDEIKGDTITLARTYLGLKAGQKVVLSGELKDLKGVFAGETRALKTVIVEAGFTVITFDRPLEHGYLRGTVTINANVALASHGEAVSEVLGSGNANQSFQQFALRQPPLTYNSAGTPSGAQTTLEVRVNDLLWQEVASFHGHGPDEHIYVSRTDNDGKTRIFFGDGKTGARLPTGQENVKAKYRKGIGLAGQVKANQLTQLMTRPPGVTAVTNAIAATGAADPEKREEARRNAPLTVLTLDRIVSLRDYEDFARAFAGIDKALATWTWFGKTRGVFVTVAGSQGAEVNKDSALYKNLLDAMRRAGDPSVPLVVESYVSKFFRLAATTQVHPDYLPEKVLAAIEQKLRETFGFEARQFGQPVNLSEVMAAIQNVSGTTAVDINALYPADQAVARRSHIPAAMPQSGEFTLFAAELLTLDPRPIDVEIQT